MATATIYPTTDARVYRTTTNETFATIRNGNGTDIDAASAAIVLAQNYSGVTVNRFDGISRAIFVFDTSSLGANAVITSATLSLYGDSKGDSYTGAEPNMVICGANPTTPATLAFGDYQNVLRTLLSDTQIVFSSWNDAGYNDFPLNAAGLAYLSKTSYSSFSSQFSWDQSGVFGGDWTAGGTQMYIIGKSVRNTGTSTDPKLVITYTAQPIVTTSPATSLALSQVSANGNITNAGGEAVTTRGFQVGTTMVADRIVSEDGSFSAGAYSLTIDGLTGGTTYYYRSFATNSQGTTYGSWQAFTTTTNPFSVTINGVDRTVDIINQSINIDDILNDQQNTCSFQIQDVHSVGLPSDGQEVVITDREGTKIFGGYIISTSASKLETGAVRMGVKCVDYSWLLDRNLVHQGYESETDAQIIADILTDYCAGFGITGTNVIAGVTIDQISFNYIQPSQAFRKIAELTGRSWYIDYDKDIHYFPTTQNPAPFNITSASNAYINLQISKDNSQLKNRVYVRGGTKLSDPTTYSVKGDGVARQFPVPDKPHAVIVTVNGVNKTVGIKNVNLTGFQFYVNFEEKYVEQDTSETLLTSTDTLAVNYTYDIPILVAVENTASIITNGVKEFAIFDKSISTTQAARDRASAELTDYASSLVEARFQTYTTGFRSGQYVNINLSEYGVNDNYVINKVNIKSMGGGKFVYDISLASAKTMGIIKFLIELLEANKNLIELNNNEVVDELLSIADSLNADSLTDALTIDSAGAYATWCTDSLQATPTTRARWGLFQWG